MTMNGSQLNEFELIRRCFTEGFPTRSDTILGVGDDASIIAPPSDRYLTQSIDTQVAQVHFPRSAPAHLIAQRAFRCALSDLAAMGAEPQGFHLALTLPSADKAWLIDFSDGLRRAAQEYGVPLLGGDTTRGTETVITIAVQGWIPHGGGLLRSHARINDDIWLSGDIGHAALALPEVLTDPERTHEPLSRGQRAYYLPDIHIALGQALIGVAHAALDISDGLVQDAQHIAERSQVDVHIQLEQLHTAVNQHDTRWATCFTGGDDYQLLFTAPPANRAVLEAWQRQYPNLHRIGHVQACARADHPSVLLWHQKQPYTLSSLSGFQHF